MIKLILLFISIATSQGCHITDIEYAWSIGPAPPIPLMGNNTPADWATGNGDGRQWRRAKTGGVPTRAERNLQPDLGDGRQH